MISLIRSNRLKLYTVLFLGAILPSVGCLNSEPAAEAPAPKSAATAAVEPPPSAATPKGRPDIQVSLATKGDELLYNKSDFTVKAGTTVQLTFANKSAGSQMSHNVVIVKPGTAEEVAQAGMGAGDANGWIPNSPQIVAHTKLVAPGQDDSVVFVAPAEEGNYPYICTYPGHASAMKGIMHVKK